ncbi:MAG: dockerin type I repeat-containing protein [Candidatus Zixiibacteriota bacterium]|nr:MAG: dockerin type I repeat-containing protein [candidate division Zixibacteria bacterium]
MKKTIFITAVLGVVALTVVLLAYAGSDRKIQSANSQPKTQTVISAAKGSSPQKAPLGDSKQGYRLVTDAISGFGGKSESDSYRIPVNSGGQPSPAGLSASTSWGAKAGYVYTTQVDRGDVNGDGIINVGDVVFLVNYLYRSGEEPVPLEAGDITCDGIVNVGDVVYLVNYLYRGGDPPAC